MNIKEQEKVIAVASSTLDQQMRWVEDLLTKRGEHFESYVLAVMYAMSEMKQEEARLIAWLALNGYVALVKSKADLAAGDDGSE